jgi:cation transport ATPase
MATPSTRPPEDSSLQASSASTPPLSVHESRPRHSARVPSLWTLIIPVLAGAAVYFAIVEHLEPSTGATDWSEELLEVLPALLAGLLFGMFVLVPLWLLFARLRAYSLLIFSCVGAVIWLACGAAILRLTNVPTASAPWVDATVMLPGLVMVVVFAVLARYLEKRAA